MIARIHVRTDTLGSAGPLGSAINVYISRRGANKVFEFHGWGSGTSEMDSIELNATSFGLYKLSNASISFLRTWKRVFVCSFTALGCPDEQSLVQK
jgi:hypothetical protein